MPFERYPLKGFEDPVNRPFCMTSREAVKILDGPGGIGIGASYGAFGFGLALSNGYWFAETCLGAGLGAKLKLPKFPTGGFASECKLYYRNPKY